MLEVDDVGPRVQQEVAIRARQDLLALAEGPLEIVEVVEIGVEQVLVRVGADERQGRVVVEGVVGREGPAGTCQQQRLEVLRALERPVDVGDVHLDPSDEQLRMVVRHEEDARPRHRHSPRARVEKNRRPRRRPRRRRGW